MAGCSPSPWRHSVGGLAIDVLLHIEHDLQQRPPSEALVYTGITDPCQEHLCTRAQALMLEHAQSKALRCMQQVSEA